MNYIYNITFVTSPAEEQRLLSWIRTIALPALFNEESPARNAALRKVVEAGGEKPGEDHGVSIALHAEFKNEKDAKQWHDLVLVPALGGLHAEFGQEALFFVTLLEQLPL